MLYVIKVEPNRVFLRALMTNFFASSPNAHVLLSHVEAYSVSDDKRYNSHLKTLWGKAADVGPVPLATQQEIEKQAMSLSDAKSFSTYCAKAWEQVARFGPVTDAEDKIEALAKRAHQRDFDNVKALFFANVIQFVRSLRMPNNNFLALPETEDLEMLRKASKEHMAKIVETLRDDVEIQKIILAEFTPEAMSRPADPPSIYMDRQPEPVIHLLPHNLIPEVLPYEQTATGAPEVAPMLH